MPVKLRLQRHGRKQRPFYHIVAADSRAPRDGRFIEKVGTYNPVSNPSSVNLSVDRALYWLQNGAVPSDKVRSILSQEGVLYKNHLQGGVKKGALTQDQADAKFETWMKDKEKKTGHLLDSMRKASDADKASRLAAEKAVSDKRASDLAAAEAAANAPVEEPASEETSEEVASVDEAPVAEASTEETPGE